MIELPFVKRMMTSHIIWGTLSVQIISTRKVQPRKKSTHLCAPREFLKQMWPCLIIIKSCYFDYRINKPFTCSRCVICVSCSGHAILTHYVRKGSWALFLKSWLPTNQRGQKIRSPAFAESLAQRSPVLPHVRSSTKPTGLFPDLLTMWYTLQR